MALWIWTKVRPTDFVYGDCAWCYDDCPASMSSGEWSDMLWRTEEMEYDLPEEEARGEHYVAADINRFRQTHYSVHLF